MSELNRLIREIESGIYMLREHRHQFLKNLVDYVPGDIRYRDTDETDETVKKIGKAIRHLNKAKCIVESMKARASASSA